MPPIFRDTILPWAFLGVILLVAFAVGGGPVYLALTWWGIPWALLVAIVMAVVVFAAASYMTRDAAGFEILVAGWLGIVLGFIAALLQRVL